MNVFTALKRSHFLFLFEAKTANSDELISTFFINTGQVTRIAFIQAIVAYKWPDFVMFICLILVIMVYIIHTGHLI